MFNVNGTVGATVFNDSFTEVFSNRVISDTDFVPGQTDTWMWTEEGNNVDLIFVEQG